MCDDMRIAALLLSAVALLGCDAYDESLLAGQGVGCTEPSRNPPTRPPAATEGEDDGVEYVFANRDAVFDQLPDAWRENGFNLDGLCTSAENLLSECLRGPGAMTVFDGTGGIDNVFASQLFALVALQYEPRPGVPGDTLARYAQDLQASGESVLLVRIRNWNGTANDPRVTVDLSVSVYGLAGSASAAPNPAPCADGAGDDCVPAWDGSGNDWFWARADNFLNGDASQPKIVDDNAFVADDVVMMSIPDRAAIDFTGPSLGLTITLTEGFAVGRISADRMRMDSMLVGRWSRNDLIETAEHVGVCAGTPNYEFLLLALQGMLDLRSDPDTSSADVECDALSMALPSTGYRARFAGVTPGAPVPNECEDE